MLKLSMWVKYQVTSHWSYNAIEVTYCIKDAVFLRCDSTRLVHSSISSPQVHYAPLQSVPVHYLIKCSSHFSYLKTCSFSVCLPWSSNWSPLRPRWCLVEEIFSSRGTSPQLPGVGPSASPLLCSGLAARAAAGAGGCVQRRGSPPAGCRGLRSALGERPPRLWLLARSQAPRGTRRRKQEEECGGSWRDDLCSRSAAGPRTRRWPALLWRS